MINFVHETQSSFLFMCFIEHTHIGMLCRRSFFHFYLGIRARRKKKNEHWNQSYCSLLYDGITVHRFIFNSISIEILRVRLIQTSTLFLSYEYFEYSYNANFVIHFFFFFCTPAFALLTFVQRIYIIIKLWILIDGKIRKICTAKR